MACKLAQINAARSYGGVNELMRTIDNLNLDVIFIQEPYQKKTTWPGFRAYCGTTAVSYTHLDVYKRQVLQENYVGNVLFN